MRVTVLACVSALAMSAPAYADDWTGFYVGLHAGYGFGENRVADDNPTLFYEIEPAGLIAGGQLGYNHQFGSFVIGIEADGTLGDLDESTEPSDPSGAFDVATIEIDYLASVRLRAGYATESTLFYVTGGVGFAAWTDRNFIGGLEFGSGADHDRTGWTAGVGVEYAVDANWSAKLEYLHYGFDEEIQPPSAFWYIGSDYFETSFDTVKVGLNYRF